MVTLAERGRRVDGRRSPLWRTAGLLGWMMCAGGFPAAHAQRPNATLTAEKLRVVHFDWVVRQVDAGPPFDEEFYLVFNVPAADSIHYSYGRRRVVSTASGERAEFDGGVVQGKARTDPLSRTNEYAIRVRPLDPDVPYLFRFTIHPRRGQQSAGGPRSTPRPVRVDAVIEAKSNFGHHVMFDAGVLGADRTGYRGLVTGVTFYAIPINREDDLSRSTPAEHVLKRVGLLAGLSFRAFRAGAEMNDFYPHLGHPVLGLSVRNIPGIPGLRLGTGVMWYRQDDDNPLVVRLVTKRDVFVSATFGPRMDDIFRRRRR